MSPLLASLNHRGPASSSKDSLDKKDNDWAESTTGTNGLSVFDDALLAK